MMMNRQYETEKSVCYNMYGRGGILYVEMGAGLVPMITSEKDFLDADTDDGFIFRIPFEECRDHIYLRALPMDLHGAQPLMSPGVEVTGGLTADACIDYGMSGSGFSMKDATVTQEILDFWDMSFADLLPVARRNMARDCTIQSLDEVLAGMMETEPGLQIESMPGISVLRCGTYGAGLLAAPRVLQMLVPDYEGCIILPSSVYELLALEPGFMTMEEARKMVTSVNLAEVEPEDRLVDGAFLMREKKLKLFA